MNPGDSGTVLIVGGDTGGHLFPGIALAGRLKDRWSIQFFIGDRAVAKEIMDREGFSFEVISGSAFPGYNILRYPNFIFVNAKGIFKSYKMLSRIKPVIVFSTGGYSSFPPVIAAWLKRIPVILHEQNLRPGLANRVLSLFAGRIAASFSGTLKCFPKAKVFLSGNPVRSGILEANKISDSRNKKIEWKSSTVLNIMVFGGSQGSRFLNELMMDALPELGRYREKLYITHLTGDADLDRVRKSYAGSGIRFEASPFSHRIWELYGRADLVIARAGATTIAELIALKKPAFLVPFAAAAGNHQYHNALYLAQEGCALMSEEKGMDGKRLAGVITGIINDRTLLEEMEVGYKALPEYGLDPTAVIESEIGGKQ